MRDRSTGSSPPARTGLSLISPSGAGSPRTTSTSSKPLPSAESWASRHSCPGAGSTTFRRCDDESLYRGMRIAARLGLPVAVHAENNGMTSALSSRARAEGRTSVRDYLDSRPIAAEAEAISRALAFAEDTGCALHVVHTSSARGVRLIRQAVEAGLCDATCETCPHYLLLCAEDVERLGARAKCAPPLRPAAERQLLLGRWPRGTWTRSAPTIPLRPRK